MRPRQQQRVVVGLGLLVLLVGAWWWRSGANVLVGPVMPVPPSPAELRGESTPAGSFGATAPAAVEERHAIVAPEGSPVRTVDVRVVDAFGLAVEGAQVLVRRDGDAEALLFARTGADGTCKVRLAAPAQFVRAHDAKVGTSIEVRIEAARANGAPLDLPLLRPVVVRGRVMLRDEPVGVVWVQVRAELRLSRPEPGIAAPLHAIEVSGPDRSFAFEAAVGASLHLEAFDDLRSLASATNVVAVDSLEVLLRADGASRRYEVHGVLVDADNVPVVGHPVEWYDSDMRSVPLVRVGREFATVGSDGRFTIAVDEPRVIVRGSLWRSSSSAVVCEFAPDRPRADVVLQLRRNVPTTGKVVGDVAAAGTVRVIEVGDESADSFEVPVAADGEFRFDFPAGSRWRLSAGGESIEVRAGQRDVVVTARAAVVRELRFQVVHADGRAPSFPWAEWWLLDGSCIERATAHFQCQEGQAMVREPRAAPWQLVVHDGAAAALVGVHPSTSELGRVFLQAPAKLTARVRRAGARMRGLDVVVEGCGPLETSRDDGAGVHRFAQLPHGPAFVHVRRGAEVLASQRIELFPGEASEVSFDLP